jgi:hypothetical protein
MEDNMAFKNVGPVTFLAPGASADWTYSFTVGTNNAADVGPQFACADIKSLGHHRTVTMLADQQRKRKGRGGTAYLVRITNQGPALGRHNLQGGGLT